MTPLPLRFLVVTALYMLLAREEITRPLWSRYPKAWNTFVLCPACAGAGIGLVLALVGEGRMWGAAGVMFAGGSAALFNLPAVLAWTIAVMNSAVMRGGTPWTLASASRVASFTLACLVVVPILFAAQRVAREYAGPREGGG